MKYTYLILNIITVLFPLLWIRDSRVNYHKKLKPLFKALIITAAVFLVWDVYFTKWGVWSFNDDFITGIKFIYLPIEEWLFFITIPFSCLFIHEVLRYYYPKFAIPIVNRVFPWFMCAACFIIAAAFHNQLYTFTTFILLAIYFAISKLVFKYKNYSRFMLSFLFCLPAFYLVNGILTSFPVVLYNDLENFGRRVGTIPLDDHFYLMLLLLMNISLFEYFKPKKKLKH